MNIKDLTDKKHVKNSPVIASFKLAVENDKKLMNKHAEDMSNLTDMFSSNSVNRDNESYELSSMIKKAVVSTSNLLSQFDFPIGPEITYVKSKNVRYASNDNTKVVSGCIILNCKIATLSGVDTDTIIPVSINRGEIIDPSVIIWDGRDYVISQSFVDNIVQRNTSYETIPQREMFEPFFDADEAIVAAESKEITGYQPREPIYMDTDKNIKRGAKKAPLMLGEVRKVMAEAEDNGEDTFPRPWNYILENYVRPLVGTVSQDIWMPHLINLGFVINPYGHFRHRTKANKVAQSDDGLAGMLNGVVLLKDGVEIDVWQGDDPIYAAVVHDGSSYTPGAALFVGSSSEDESLQEAYDLLETNQTDNLSEEDVRRIEEDAKEHGMDPLELMTETYDGRVFTMTKEEFVNTFENLSSEINKKEIEKVYDSEDFEDEDFDDREGSKTAQQDRKLLTNLGDVNFTTYGGFLVFQGEQEPEVEIVDTWRLDTGDADDENDPDMRWDIYRFPIEKLDENDWWWDRLDQAADSVEMDEDELKELLTSDDPIERAIGYQALVGYFGAHEFDSYPLELNAEEMEKRYPGLIEPGELTGEDEDFDDREGSRTAQVVDIYPSYIDEDGDVIYQLPFDFSSIEELMSLADQDETLDSFLWDLQSSENVENKAGNIIFSGSDIIDAIPKPERSSIANNFNIYVELGQEIGDFSAKRIKRALKNKFAIDEVIVEWAAIDKENSDPLYNEVLTEVMISPKDDKIEKEICNFIIGKYSNKTNEDEDEFYDEVEEEYEHLDISIKDDLDKKEPRNWPGSKTPMEKGDRAKFNGNDGPIRGKIITINDDDDYLIVESRGMQYRVHVEDVEAMPSTHNKMWKEQI